jgi:hypothetical protein
LRLLLKELEVVGDPFFEWGFVRFWYTIDMGFAVSGSNFRVLPISFYHYMFCHLFISLLVLTVRGSLYM